MKLCLNEHESFPIKLEQEFAAGEILPEFQGLISLGQGKVLLSIQKADEEYYCQGSLNSKAQLECARCLEPYETELVSDIDFIACSQEHYDSLKSEAVDDEDYVFIDSTDVSIDITAPIEQALILAVSMKPLCAETCRGICPMCGSNLNQTKCDCNNEKIDPRWDGLRGLNGG
ncbi:MAG: DUF177 domain-containing protein [bacterium]|nr:DUF177 domain-containing protein [bacterium]